MKICLNVTERLFAWDVKNEIKQNILYHLNFNMQNNLDLVWYLILNEMFELSSVRISYYPQKLYSLHFLSHAVFDIFMHKSQCYLQLNFLHAG